ncbi:heterokaryon incompatibility protein-domain-containing protein [Xylaria curta]|nr:heterokaryon incompatibility protein-domain-containing protein [Xylaria curta]
MQQLIKCSKDAFAFGEPDEIVLKNYDYLLTEDCLPLSRVYSGIADPKYGYRYKLLWDGIRSFSPISELNLALLQQDEFLVALVVISNGPLFVDVRRHKPTAEGRELHPAITGIHLQFYIPTVNVDQGPFVWPAIGKAHDIPSSIGLSQSDLALPRLWLKDCITGTGKHQNCGKTEDPPLLPTRVIDVGNSDAGTHLHISRTGEKSHYVALSHCWGGEVPVMSTTSTMPEFVKRLPSDLPKTFADAIALTRALGQRYLWIDSFCILQDSVEDWISESSLMDQVYSQAILTISADAAEDSFSGFLEPPARNVQKTSVIYEPISTDTASQVAIHVRRRGDLAFQLPYHDFYPNDPWIKEPWDGTEELIIRSKLSTRAWAFQERLLSPRTLHFGPSEMAWECRGLCACECSATNERTSRTTSLLKGSVALQPPSEGSIRSLDNAWRGDIVNLTKETDRLSGITGVAKRALALRAGDQYMAGIWRKTIREGLSWFATPKRPSRRLLSENSSLIWSWASVSGQIQHARVAGVPSDASLMEVLDVQYTPDAKSPIGAGPQTPASLLGSGYLVPIESLWYQPYSGGMTIYRSCYRIKWPGNVSLPYNCVAMMDVNKADIPSDGNIQLDRLDNVELEDMNLTMLLTALSKGVVYGLILNRRSASGDVPEFDRVGFVNGQDEIGRIIEWTSGAPGSSSPMFRTDWDPDDHGGIHLILKKARIRKSRFKIW